MGIVLHVITLHGTDRSIKVEVICRSPSEVSCSFNINVLEEDI